MNEGVDFAKEMVDKWNDYGWGEVESKQQSTKLSSFNS